MRKILFGFSALLLPFLAQGETHRHMVMINQTGIGGFASYEHFNPRSSSLFDNYEILTGNFELNYSYSLNERWQLGGFFQNYSQTRDINLQQGPRGKIETDTRVLGLQVFYNFSEELANSWLVGGIISYLNQEEEYDKSIQDFLEDDRQAVSFEVMIGKRFSLFPEGPLQVSYSPAASVFVMNSTKDYADDKINYSYGLNLHFLKFDLLF